MAPAMTTEQLQASTTTKLKDNFWNWNGFRIRYQVAGEDNTGPSILLVHGFGGNADHWRKNTPNLAQASNSRVFAIDLIGYGYSDKPNPLEMSAVNGELTRDLKSYERFAPPGAPRYGSVGDTPFTDMAHPLGSGYNFYTWADQLKAFSEEVIRDRNGVFLACNSIGSCAGLQMAVDYPSQVRGVVICDPSLRLLNIKRQNPLTAPLVSLLQTVLRETAVGEGFFSLVAKEETVKNILGQAYGDKQAVTDELVQAILRPGLTPNAPRVFLDFISYSAGPLPEEQLAILSSPDYLAPPASAAAAAAAAGAAGPAAGGYRVPVQVLWGERDPWEPVDLGRRYQKFGCVESFEIIPGAGHCPQDERPDVVNAKVLDFVSRHS